MADWSEVGNDVRRVRADRYRTAECYLLPAGAAFAGKGRTGEQGTRCRPKSSDVGSAVGSSLVEANTANETIGIGTELHSQSDRVCVAAIHL